MLRAIFSISADLPSLASWTKLAPIGEDDIGFSREFRTSYCGLAFDLAFCIS
jgi:hypothetical protein